MGEMHTRKDIVKALELDRDGDWDGAHRIVQRIETRDANRVHAYLHREEGDLGNANYWYRRAGTRMPDESLKSEWQVLWDDMSG